MASKLTLRGNWWYTYVCVSDRKTGTKKQYPIKLKPKGDKKEAYICLDEVNQKEKYIKAGLKVDFSWNNDNIGRSKVSKLNIKDAIDEWLKVRKKFWLAPIFFFLILLGFLIVLTEGTAIAPFIYALF